MNPITNYCEAILGNNTSAKKTIRLIPELSNCSDELLDLIFTYSKAVNIKEGEVLIKEGLFDQWVYFMVKGQLDIFVNNSKLGSTPGSLVGERCIIGEPRGATLVAGEDGVMALGIEMSLMDEINRQINDFSQTETDVPKILAFSNEKNKIVIELLAIVLNEVILRILDLSQTSLYILKHLILSLKEKMTSISNWYKLIPDFKKLMKQLFLLNYNKQTSLFFLKNYIAPSSYPVLYMRI